MYGMFIMYYTDKKLYYICLSEDDSQDGFKVDNDLSVLPDGVYCVNPNVPAFSLNENISETFTNNYSPYFQVNDNKIEKVDQETLNTLEEL